MIIYYNLGLFLLSYTTYVSSHKKTERKSDPEFAQLQRESNDYGDEQLSSSEILQSVGCKGDNGAIQCSNSLDLEDVVYKINHIRSQVRSISLEGCIQTTLNFSIFTSISSLEKLSIKHCFLENLIISSELRKIRALDLSHNKISNWTSVCSLTIKLPALKSLVLSYNKIDILNIDKCFHGSLRLLNVSHNEIDTIEIIPKADILDFSQNQPLISIHGEWPSNLKRINASGNPLLSNMPDFASLSYLTHIDVDHSALSHLPVNGCQNLKFISARYTRIEVINFREIGPALEHVDLDQSKWLSFVFGKLQSRVGYFRLTNSLVSYLPKDFFSNASNLRVLKLKPNVWNCNECLIEWLSSLPLERRPAINCTRNNELTNCDLGIAEANPKIVRARLTDSAILPCVFYGEPSPSIEWWLVRPKTLIGTYNAIATMNWTRGGAYRIISGGSLFIKGANRDLVERYECVAINEHGNKSILLHFRLDYSDWYSLNMFKSVFWGSVVCSMLVCAASFILNLLWIVSRKTILWWIQRAERMSRVRQMVEAMEKYRQRQMEHLQDTYHRGMEQVRDNYHSQVEQLRSSYASQAERFRGYRAAQIEYVNQQLESIRENYNQQMLRLREYGSRRGEQLWESYERQVNRIRTFSLQQRLKLIRQYKVKQQYVNKLFQNFNDSAAYNKEHSEAAVLGSIKDLGEPPLSRSSSYYSLPEYVLDEEGSIYSPTRSIMSTRILSRHQHKSTTSGLRPAFKNAPNEKDKANVSDTDSFSTNSPLDLNCISTEDTSLPSTSAEAQSAPKFEDVL